MNTSMTLHVSDVPPPPLTVEEMDGLCEPLASRRTTHLANPAAETPGRALEAIEMEHGGVAFALDEADDLAPHWVEWIEWVELRDTRERHHR
jgi:hypothetical protein